MEAVQVHRAGAADSFPTGASEGKGGVHFVFDFYQDVQVHGFCVGQVDVVGHEVGLILGVFGVGPVN